MNFKSWLLLVRVFLIMFLKQDESERAFRETCLYALRGHHPISIATSDTLRGAGQGGSQCKGSVGAARPYPPCPAPVPVLPPREGEATALRSTSCAVRERTFPRPSLALHVALEMRMERRLGRADGDALPVGQDGGLDGGAVGDRLLRGDVAVWLAPVELLP